jgi:hypothetical protein
MVENKIILNRLEISKNRIEYFFIVEGKWKKIFF